MTTPLAEDGLRLRFWMDDLAGGSETVVALGDNYGWTVYRHGQSEPVAKFVGVPCWPSWADFEARAGDLAHGGEGRIYNTRTWQRLLPPPGRRFHPDLARFAPDGRFARAAINRQRVLIDTQTDKSFPTQGGWGNLPGVGMIGAMAAVYGATIRLLPPAARLDIPADLLELWAQVAVRGEIGPDGAFVKWDEATWERKRQELAAKPAPYPDFPFPGHVATDRLHWLRQEYENASDANKPDLAKQLLDRAEAAGDQAEAVRWRTTVTPKSPPTKPAASK